MTQKRRRRSETRSRNGCTVCRKRKVKCDEKHPHCSNCQRLKLSCNYEKSLLWHEDALARGISFGRSKKYQNIKSQRTSSKSFDQYELTLSELCQQNKIWVKINNESLFLNTLVDDFTPQSKDIKIDETLISIIGIYNSIQGDDNKIFEVDENFGVIDDDNSQAKHDDLYNLGFYNESHSPIFKNLPTIPLSFDIINIKDFTKESQAYDYMINKIFPNCICYGGDFKSKENPYLNYLVPMSTSSSILFKALIYYSAQVFSLINKEFNEISMQYRNEVLKDLPELIKLKQMIELDDWEDIFGTIVILCSSNISSECDMQWIVHADGGKKLLNKLNKPIDPFKRFFIRNLTVHEILKDTIIQNNDCLKYSENELFKNDADDNIDLMLGCSTNLLRIIDEITKLGEYYESLEFETGDNKMSLEKLILDKRDIISNKLINLRQSIIGDIDINTYGIVIVSEIKQLSTELYLLARINLFYFKLNNRLGITKTLNQINNLILQIIAKLKLLDYCTMTITWPLFLIGVIGSNLDEESRWFILKKFTEMENLRSLANIKLARTTVESVWKYRDLNEDELLTWKDLMNFNSKTLSLA